jgi:D-alanine-D-alanine ligase
MKIGITYGLREEYITNGFGEEETAEFDRADTIESIDQALQKLGCKTDWVGNIQNLAKRLVAGDRWDLVC